jgi:hypothetical protein
LAVGAVPLDAQNARPVARRRRSPISSNILHVEAPSQWADKWKLLVTRCKHITAEHRKNWNRVKSPSSHAEMIADQTNGKTYANCSNSSALAGHSNDAVF